MRTDIHRPSVIIPEDYSFVAFDYIKLEMGDILENCHMLQEARAAKKAHMDRTGGKYSQHEHGGSCHICGAAAIYTVTFYHKKTNSYIKTGQDCAQKLEMSFNDAAMNLFRNAIADARHAVAGKKKAQVTLADAGLTAAWEIYAVTVPALRAAAQAQFDISRIPYEEITIEDIVGKLVKYGSVSDKATNYLRTLLDKIDNRAAIEAKRKAEAEAAAPCPTGRVTITGTVLSTKLQDGFYGATLKMLVKDDSGFKVWGTCPDGFNRDCRVTFTAMVEPSKDDNKFGFFKRPTKAMVIA